MPLAIQRWRYRGVHADIEYAITLCAVDYRVTLNSSERRRSGATRAALRRRLRKAASGH